MSALPSLRDTVEQHGLWADKSFGQHFLFDLNLTRRIARAAGDLTGMAVFEVGPGPGGLTRALLESDAEKVIAIEVDTRCLSVLEELQNHGDNKDRLEIIAADALQIDLTELAAAPRAIIANLPYNVGTLLLVNWLHQARHFRSMTLLFQKEVAERIIAAPRTKDYGRLSVLAQTCCHADIMFDIAPEAFTPPPKIMSSLVHLTPRENVSVDLKILGKITASAFGQRRKMLRSSLKSLIPSPEILLESLGLLPTARAEELSVADFAKLAKAFALRQNNLAN